MRNARTTILTLLKEKPLTKKEMSALTNYSVGTLGNELAALTRNYLLTENRGTYSITDQGREYLLNPKNLNRQDKIPDFSKNAICFVINEEKKRFKTINPDKLLPFVFAYYLRVNPEAVGSIRWNVAMPNEDELKQIVAIFNELFMTEEEKNSED